jgi:hypothetical protein
MSTKTITGTRNGKQVTKSYEVTERDGTRWVKNCFGTTGYWQGTTISTYRGKVIIENVREVE